MTDKTEMPADGKGTDVKPTDHLANHKRGSSESDGGAYPNPHTGSGDEKSPKHGGQSEIDYSGPENENATTGS
jgi:hypothetical protein